MAAHAVVAEVTLPEDRSQERDPGGRPQPATVLTAALVVYGLMLLGALSWLGLRGRLAALPAASLGEHGLWVAAGVGLGTGVAFATALRLTARASTGVARCERRLAGFLGALSDRSILCLSLGSAVAEELFFRLAVQDALGPIAAVALYVLLNTGPGFWPWLPVALVTAVTLSGFVLCGLGLLSVTVTHALITYLTLRRILPS